MERVPGIYERRCNEVEADRIIEIVKDLLERAFGGSAEKLIVAALGKKKASKEELSQIRRIIDEFKRGGP